MGLLNSMLTWCARWRLKHCHSLLSNNNNFRSCCAPEITDLRGTYLFTVLDKRQTQSPLMASSVSIWARGLPRNILQQPHIVSASRGGLSFTHYRMSSDFLNRYAKLPSLPVPKLNQTINTYLRTVKPLITPEEYEVTQKVAREFAAPGSIGEKLQQMLEEKGAKEANWLSEWWLDAAYLSYRLPVVVHSSPALVFPKQEFHSERDQLEYAAKLISGALHYKQRMDEGMLEQDYLGKSPLCMTQYTKIFNTCRIPGAQVDTTHSCLDAKHIVIACNNHFYKLNPYTAQGKISSEADILNSLLQIAEISKEPANQVGFLTSDHRNFWGVMYEALRKDPENATSIQAIEDSIFIVCIDKPLRACDQATPRSRMALQLLHGYGSDNNSGNRWFDKTLQLIVGADGTNGLIYEHSPTEGPPIANLADYIISYAKGKIVKEEDAATILRLDRLSFNLTRELIEAVGLAMRNIDLLVEDVDLNSFSFDKFGKEEIKALKFSPDSFIQVALQMAFIRVHGYPAAHYESGSTRKFSKGRTDTIRTCLPEVVDFARLHLGNDTQDSLAKFKALKVAITAHKDYVFMAISGQAIDRHLLGLKRLAIENGIDIPDLYMDAGFSTSNNWRISTSQVASAHDAIMCFGAVVPDGYGCCYNPRTNAINFAVSAFNSNPTTCVQKFREALEASLVEMRDLAAAHVHSNL